jgi:hypothetical protein
MKLIYTREMGDKIFVLKVHLKYERKANFANYPHFWGSCEFLPTGLGIQYDDRHFVLETQNLSIPFNHFKSRTVFLISFSQSSLSFFLWRTKC